MRGSLGECGGGGVDFVGVERVGDGAAGLQRVAYRERWAENSQVIAAEAAEPVIGPAPACRGRAVEETLETRWRDHGEEADGFVAAPLPRVRRGMNTNAPVGASSTWSASLTRSVPSRT